MQCSEKGSAYVTEGPLGFVELIGWNLSGSTVSTILQMGLNQKSAILCCYCDPLLPPPGRCEGAGPGRGEAQARSDKTPWGNPERCADEDSCRDGQRPPGGSTSPAYVSQSGHGPPAVGREDGDKCGHQARPFLPLSVLSFPAGRSTPAEPGRGAPGARAGAEPQGRPGEPSEPLSPLAAHPHRGLPPLLPENWGAAAGRQALLRPRGRRPAGIGVQERRGRGHPAAPPTRPPPPPPPVPGAPDAPGRAEGAEAAQTCLREGG